MIIIITRGLIPWSMGLIDLLSQTWLQLESWFHSL